MVVVDSRQGKASKQKEIKQEYSEEKDAKVIVDSLFKRKANKLVGCKQKDKKARNDQNQRLQVVIGNRGAKDDSLLDQGVGLEFG